jgi:hypothetical protein
MAWDALLQRADKAVRQQLGGTVTYTPGVGGAVTVTGIFDAAYVRAEAGRPGVSSSGPAVFLRLADLPSDPETDEAATVTVGGTTYRVAEPQKDGQGGVLLQLFKAT